MKLLFEISNEDVINIRDFYNDHRDCWFVKNRIKKNIRREGIVLSREVFWQAIAVCLLTTQQRSGPGSAIAKFILAKPFQLNLTDCSGAVDISVFASQLIKDASGIRRGPTIGEELCVNFKYL